MLSRPHCPACGEPCEDDGDRYYHDRCYECGWRSPERIEQDRKNRERIAESNRKMRERKENRSVAGHNWP